MDNRVDLPGYKRYVAADGARPAVCVAFLDLAEDDACAIDGALVAVDARALAVLDARERNYVRLDVSDAVAGAPGRVWTYVGRDDARERARAARAAGTLVVQRAYLEDVERAFTALGDGALERFRASTDPPGCPVVELERVDLPA
jgi:hypothetical protein